MGSLDRVHQVHLGGNLQTYGEFKVKVYRFRAQKQTLPANRGKINMVSVIIPVKACIYAIFLEPEDDSLWYIKDGSRSIYLHFVVINMKSIK